MQLLPRQSAMVVKAGVADPSRNPDFTPVACTAYTATLRANPELWTLAALAYAPAKRPAGTTGAASVIATINAAWRRDPAASGMVQRRTETSLCAVFSASGTKGPCSPRTRRLSALCSTAGILSTQGSEENRAIASKFGRQNSRKLARKTDHKGRPQGAPLPGFDPIRCNSPAEAKQLPAAMTIFVDMVLCVYVNMRIDAVSA